MAKMKLKGLRLKTPEKKATIHVKINEDKRQKRIFMEQFVPSSAEVEWLDDYNEVFEKALYDFYYTMYENDDVRNSEFVARVSPFIDSYIKLFLEFSEYNPDTMYMQETLHSHVKVAYKAISELWYTKYKLPIEVPLYIIKETLNKYEDIEVTDDHIKKINVLRKGNLVYTSKKEPTKDELEKEDDILLELEPNIFIKIPLKYYKKLSKLSSIVLDYSIPESFGVVTENKASIFGNSIKEIIQIRKSFSNMIKSWFENDIEQYYGSLDLEKCKIHTYYKDGDSKKHGRTYSLREFDEKFLPFLDLRTDEDIKPMAKLYREKDYYYI